MDFGTSTANELAKICADGGNQAAWKEFVRRFQRPIASVVLRTAREWGEFSSMVVDDLVQDIFLRLCIDDCRLLRGFVPRQTNSILGYLKVIAANITHDHFRAQRSSKRGGEMRRAESDSDMTEDLPAPECQHKTFETEIQIRQIDRILRGLPLQTVSHRDRKIFWLYYREGFSARDISEVTAGLGVKGVESALNRTTRLLKKIIDP